MEDRRIHVHNADADDAGGGPSRPSFLVIATTFAAIAVTFALVTARPADHGASDAGQGSPDLAASEIEVEPGFRRVATIPSGPWDPFRLSGAYLFESPDGPIVITDEDVVSRIDLPGLEVLFGAIPTPGGSLAYGRSDRGPTLWWSHDNLTWTTEILPWDGTVRAASANGGQLVVIGVENSGRSFSYVVASATRTLERWRFERDVDVPDSFLVSIPGGFLGRGRSTDGTGSGVGYLYSPNGTDWTFQSDRAAGIAGPGGMVPFFVVGGEDGDRIRIGGDSRTVEPPTWPVSGLWIEGETIWIQTRDAAWSSIDGTTWTEYPIDDETGGGFSMLLPVGTTPRLVTVDDNTVSLLRWDPGTPGDPAP